MRWRRQANVEIWMNYPTTGRKSTLEDINADLERQDKSGLAYKKDLKWKKRLGILIGR